MYRQQVFCVFSQLTEFTNKFRFLWTNKDGNSFAGYMIINLKCHNITSSRVLTEADTLLHAIGTEASELFKFEFMVIVNFVIDNKLHYKFGTKRTDSSVKSSETLRASAEALGFQSAVCCEFSNLYPQSLICPRLQKRSHDGLPFHGLPSFP